jgi:hypothetical protein
VASSNNTALYARGQPAGYFEGDVQVTGTLSVAGLTADVFSVIQALQQKIMALQAAIPQSSFAVVQPNQPQVTATEGEQGSARWLLAVAGSAEQTTSNVSVLPGQGIPADGFSYWTGTLNEVTPDGTTVTTLGTFTTKTNSWVAGTVAPLWHGTHKFSAAGNQLCILWFTTSSPPLALVPESTTIVLP